MKMKPTWNSRTLTLLNRNSQSGAPITPRQVIKCILSLQFDFCICYFQVTFDCDPEYNEDVNLPNQEQDILKSGIFLFFDSSEYFNSQT